MQENLEDIIRDHIHIKNHSPGGWQTVYCEVCGDGSRTKGPRGGWMLNGDSASYHCFNCGIKGALEPPYSMNDNVKKILDGFQIPLNKVLYLRLQSSNSIANIPKEKPTFNELEIPDYFVPLMEAKKHPCFNLAINLIKNEKCIEPDSYTFFLSTGSSKKSAEDNSKALYYKTRLIIPAYRKGKMIYYQSRALINGQKKYLSVDKPRLGSMYFMDRLYDDTESRLFITEGFWDAYHLNGVAVMENFLTVEQEKLLIRSKKQKIVVPDRYGTSDSLLESAEKNGWSVAIPPYDDNVKDVTESIKKNGKLYTIKLITDHLYSGTNVKYQILLRKS